MDHGPGAGSGNDTLSLLLSMLNNKEPGSSIASVVNVTTINLLCNLLHPVDYVNVATRLSETSDVLNLLDFILHLLRDRTSPDPTSNFNRRAKRLMLKIISTNPVIPRSLIVTEVAVPAKRNYIAGGAYGGVCKGELRGEIVALKVLYRTGDNVAFCREALTWATLKHEFVLSFLGIYEQQEEMFLVSPYMENGTLAQWRKNAKPSVNETWERILEVAQGMEYIHSEGVIHGDLRGDNVLLDANLHVQIADFGLTRLLDATNTQSGAKHLNFSAPELFGCLEDADDPSAVEPARTQMSDVYSFGCLYYEIYFDRIPFAGRPEGQIVALVIQDKRPNRLDEPPLSDGAWEVIQQCWVREPQKRPGIKDVVGSLIATSQSMSLSSLLNDKKPGSSIASVPNVTTINSFDPFALARKTTYPHVAPHLSTPAPSFESGSRRTFKMFDAGWILPAERKRPARDDGIPNKSPRKGGAAEGTSARNNGGRRAVASVGATGVGHAMETDEVEDEKYCFCGSVSYGEMIACDDDECEREWFHIACVGLTSIPQGHWYCSACGEKRNAHRLSRDETRKNVNDDEGYCFCGGVSYGEMIACEDDKCEREWFHIACVRLTSIPQGQWYCSACNKKRNALRPLRGGRRNNANARSAKAS